MKDNVFVLPENACQECRRREATRLCDFVICEWKWCGHPPIVNGKFIDNKMHNVSTCDRKLCTVCSTKIGDNDFCKKHFAEIKKKVIGK